MPTNIVVAGDSCGHQLGKFLKEKELPAGTCVWDGSKGGADLEDLFKTIRSLTRTARHEHQDYETVVILFGGICSLTTKRRGEVSYKPRQGIVTEINTILSDIEKYCNVDTAKFISQRRLYQFVWEQPNVTHWRRGKL